MKKITENIITEEKAEEEYVVNGEGCLNDCPKTSWVSPDLGCGLDSSFITTRL